MTSIALLLSRCISMSASVAMSDVLYKCCPNKRNKHGPCTEKEQYSCLSDILRHCSSKPHHPTARVSVNAQTEVFTSENMSKTSTVVGVIAISNEYSMYTSKF